MLGPPDLNEEALNVVKESFDFDVCDEILGNINLPSDNDINVEELFNFDISDEMLASVDIPSVNPVTTGQNAMPVMSGCVTCTFNM